MPFTTLVNNFVDTSVEFDTRVVAQGDISVTRDIREIGAAFTSIAEDLRSRGTYAGISYVGPLNQTGSSSSSSTLSISVPDFVTAGTHVILAVTHASGGNVTGATDSQGNSWTVDQPSTYNGTTGLAVISGHIFNSMLAGDQIVVS